ncbi:MAG: gliding motility-associated-like protein [Flavobacteriaceae bacterium]|jgi:gliding motility-associated-like protein
MRKLKYIFRIFLFLIPTILFAQEVTLFQQFNGRFDYLSFGNTLNIGENGGTTDCTILSESSADFQLQTGQQVVAAYLYWAGSGDEDFEVSLNGNPVVSEREFNFSFVNNNNVYDFFAAFADVTSIVSTIGNDIYTLSELDLLESIQPYCQINGGNATNFGGWSVTVIYEDATLPLNQVAIFDGLETVYQGNTTLTIELNNLNVLDNTGAKIGFLAWEGDSSLANNETLSINGNTLSNPPLNPQDNAFNGTNSFTGSSELYNMDIDFYNIENNINPGDTSATIQLTSNQDLVMVNNIVTVLNTELPDATIEIDTLTGNEECGNRDLNIDYTVYNVNSTAVLPQNTPIAFYADAILIGQTVSNTEIPIDSSEYGTITLTIPVNIPTDFLLRVVVDDTGNETGIVNESNEDNNEFSIEIHLLLIPEFESPIDLELCDILGTEVFNLTDVTQQIDPIYTLSYHLTEEEANNNENEILAIESFENTENPQSIFIRVDNQDCYVVDSFQIEVIECPLPDATISINNNIYACRERNLIIDYTVFNYNATALLPASTPIAFYIEGILLGQSQTQNDILINESETQFIEFILPDETPNNFEILLKVDDTGFGEGIVEEIDEENNEFLIQVEFGTISPIDDLPNLFTCDEGFGTATFNLTQQNDLISTDINDVITYFTTLENAILNENEISDPGNYLNETDPQLIYVRLENEICFTTSSFLIETENCPPFIPEGFSPNADNINDVFEIDNLLNIYPNFELNIYSRYGNLIYQGFNDDGFWNGIANKGVSFNYQLVPTGLYFYALHLNDPQHPNQFIGNVYINY